jgi:hypothetical protein
VIAKALRNSIASVKNEIPALLHAMPIIVPESNMPLALDLQYQLKTVYSVKCEFMLEDSDKSTGVAFDMPGSVTTRHNKATMVHLLKRYLETEQIGFSPIFVSNHETMVFNVRKEIIKELQAFSRILETKEGPGGSPVQRVYYSGKVAGGQDDFVMTIAIGIYMKHIFDVKDKYAPLRD